MRWQRKTRRDPYAKWIGVTGQDVADFYKDQLFKQKSNAAAGPAKVDAQFMSVALATYFTSRRFADGDYASDYGFNVTDLGIGYRVVNVGSNGAAFDVSSGDNLTIIELLEKTDAMTLRPGGVDGFNYIYDLNGDGIIDEFEAALRAQANSVYSTINEQGD